MLHGTRRLVTPWCSCQGYQPPPNPDILEETPALGPQPPRAAQPSEVVPRRRIVTVRATVTPCSSTTVSCDPPTGVVRDGTTAQLIAMGSAPCVDFSPTPRTILSPPQSSQWRRVGGVRCAGLRDAAGCSSLMVIPPSHTAWAFMPREDSVDAAQAVTSLASEVNSAPGNASSGHSSRLTKKQSSWPANAGTHGRVLRL